MALPKYLSTIRSAGLYRYVFDKTQVPQTERETLRIVLGYSEKGPFNTPLYVEDANDYIKTFGNISRRMERKGIFFNRLCIQALEEGPILALNMKPFNADPSNPETASIYAFNASDIGFKKTTTSDGTTYDYTTQETPHTIHTAQIASTRKGTRNQGVTSIYDTNRFWKVDAERLHDISFLDSNNASEGSNDYIRICHTADNVESNTVFIRPYVPSTGWHVKVSDWYSAQTDQEMPAWAESIKDHYLDEYFAEVYVFRGDLKKPELFSSDGTLGSTISCQFIYEYDENGYVVYWDSDSDYPEKPKMLAIKFYDENGYQKVWSSCEATDSDVQKQYASTYVGNWQTDFMGWTSNELISEPTETDEIKMSWQPFCKVVNAVDESGSATGETYLMTNNNFHSNYGPLDDALDAMSDVDTSNYIGSYNGILFPSFKSGEGSYISLDNVFNQDYQTHKMLMHMNESLLDEAADLDTNYDEIYDSGDVDSEGNSVAGGIYDHSKNIEEQGGDNSTNYKSPASFVHALTSAVCLLNSGENGNEFSQYTTEEFNASTFSCYGLFIKGYTYNSISRADKGADLISKIMGVLSYKGIREALTNNVDADYHYIIDTFQTYPGFAMKATLSQVAKEKDNCFAILNFPDIDEIMKYCGVSKYDGGFDMSVITKGSSGISLPTESQGASWAAFYTQLKYSDGSSKFNIPSAALVSNLYMVKRAKRQAYQIVAGPNYGAIKYNGVVGPDYSYARADLDVLEPFGVNAIVYMPRYGTCINGNQTAKQTPKTALSKAHIRELVIFIQDEVEKVLRDYQWELNTSTLRDNVRDRCTTILELVEANGGIYDFDVTCNETNNTPEIIDNEMLIVDIGVEPARGAEKCIQTLTLYRTGQMSSSEATA